jgi:hypothetical protein
MEKGSSLLKTKLTDFVVILIFLFFAVSGIFFSAKIYGHEKKKGVKEIKIAVRGNYNPLKPGFSFSADGINYSVTAVDAAGSNTGTRSFITLKADGITKKLNRLSLAKTFIVFIPEYKYTLKGPIIDEHEN